MLKITYFLLKIIIYPSYMKRFKIIGCLYGQVIGDALGTRYEFKNSWTVKQLIVRDKINGVLPILGEGPFMVDRGQVTDDTELAFGLLDSIIRSGGYVKEAAAQNYIAWYHSHPFDIGYNTRAVMENSRDYGDLISKADKNSLSNGCLMRISPMGIYGVEIENSKLLEYCQQDCKMTNPNPIAVNAVQVFVIAIKTALHTNTNDRSVIFNEAFKYAREPLVQKILTRAKERKKSFLLSDGTTEIPTSDAKYMGYLGIALQMAFYELLYGKSFYDSLLNVISQGGDTDTNGCIVGALLGAFYGINGINGIPASWIQDVMIDNKRRRDYPLINQLYLKEIALKLASIGRK